MVEFWGSRRGYCHYCDEFVDEEPVWEVKHGCQIACCVECAVDRNIISL